MKKLIALVAVTVCVAYATTYIQTSPTGAAPWKPVKDSVSRAHISDSALAAPASGYADSSRASGLADSAKRAGWAPLDSGRVRGIVSDTAATLRTGMGAYIPLAGSENITGNLLSNHNNLGSSAWPWNNVYGLNFYGNFSGALTSSRIIMNGNITSNGFDTIGAYLFSAGKGYRTIGGTPKGFLKADGSVDSSGSISRSDSAISSSISDSAKILTKYLRNDRNDTLKNASFIVNNGAFRIYNNSVYSQYGFYTGNDAGWIERIAYNGVATMSQYKLSSLNTAPASSTATGTLGEIRWCNGYVYLCVATNTWQRAALTAW